MRRIAVGALGVTLVVAMGAGQASAGGGNSVKAHDFEFTPSKITIAAGEKVRWKATQGTHTVTLRGGGLDDTISADGDAKTSKKFNNPGTYKYFCRFHERNGMRGKVVVTK